MQTMQTAPPLDLDLGTVDTSRPQIKDQTVADFRVDKFEIKPTEAGGKMLAVECKTLGPTKSQKDADLGPGITVFHNLNLVPTGKATWDMVAQNLGEFVQAIGLPPGTAKIQNGVVNVEQWAPMTIGVPFRAKVAYVGEGVNPKNGKAFKSKNEFLTFYKKGA